MDAVNRHYLATVQGFLDVVSLIERAVLDGGMCTARAGVHRDAARDALRRGWVTYIEMEDLALLVTVTSAGYAALDELYGPGWAQRVERAMRTPTAPVNNPDPAVNPAKNPRRVGAPNHHHNTGSGEIPMVDAESRVPSFTLAADVVLFAYDQHGALHVLLIERGWDPFAGYWALPGGHVDAGETFEQAARRELVEETGLTAPTGLVRVGVYDAPGRDPRGRVISVAYAGYLPRLVAPTAGDDATAARWVPVDDMQAFPLAFDHADILRDATETVTANTNHEAGRALRTLRWDNEDLRQENAELLAALDEADTAVLPMVYALARCQEENQALRAALDAVNTAGAGGEGR